MYNKFNSTFSDALISLLIPLACCCFYKNVCGINFDVVVHDDSFGLAFECQNDSFGQ